MAGVVRPLRTQQHSLLHHLLSLSLSNKPTSLIQQQHHYYKKQQLSFFSQTNLNAHRSNSVRLKGTLLPANLQENNSDSESSDEGRNRNKKKREARRAVQWGIDLANFSNPQIKRIFRVAAVEIEVFEAIMLVKRLGPDVREGKRRQFSYIGRLLRNVQHDLMDALIQAMKDGDESKLQALSGTEALISAEDEEEGEEIEHEEEDEECNQYIDIATRWFEGLIEKDSVITNEVYSIHNVDFDRQELRKLVRNVHSIQDCQSDDEGNKRDVALAGTKKSLNRFLLSLAKQIETK